jgi:hypothetical protein
LATLQQQQQLLAAHHQHQHNPSSVQQAHAGMAGGQQGLQAQSLMQITGAHGHHQPASTAGLQAAMQQQLQQSAATANAAHPMAAAFAQVIELAKSI